MISFSFGSFLFAEMAGTVGLFGDSGGLQLVCLGNGLIKGAGTVSAKQLESITRAYHT